MPEVVANMMSRWYLVYTKQASEISAESNLKRQGYEVYLPRLAQTVTRRGRSQDRIVALFPRYLFLRLTTASQTLGAVRSTVGVANVVRFGSSFATVPDQLIRVLQGRADSQTGLHRLEPPSLPRSGAAIRVEFGPFDGIEGVFEQEVGDDRAVVLLNFLGQNTRVDVPIEAILLSPAACACG